jgi:hypothetical protein
MRILAAADPVAGGLLQGGVDGRRRLLLAGGRRCVRLRVAKREEPVGWLDAAGGQPPVLEERRLGMDGIWGEMAAWRSGDGGGDTGGSRRRGQMDGGSGRGGEGISGVGRGALVSGSVRQG